MSEKSKIQERLKDIATAMAELCEIETLTDEQESQYQGLEAESDRLTVELDKLRAEDEKAERREKAAAILDNARRSSRTTTPSGFQSVRNIRAAVAEDPKRGFKNLADFALEITENHVNPRTSDRLMQAAAGTPTQSQYINADGGVLVPPAFSKTIWDRVLMKSNSLLSMCDQIPVDQGVESVTIPAINETSRADGSRQGGVRGYWKSEMTGMTGSSMKFRELKLSPHELYVFIFITDKLLRNAPTTAARMLETGAADEISFKIGDSIINGDGAGKPVGIVGHTATVSVAKETGQAASTVLYENLSKMWARCHGNWRSGAVWFTNQDVETALRNLQFPVGTGGIPVYLPPGGASDTPYSQLFGRPIIPIEYCQTLGTVGDIILGNLNAYAAGVKGLADASYSMHLKFDYAQTCYRVIFEVDGQPWLNSAITPFKGSNTLSPFVTLATRS